MPRVSGGVAVEEKAPYGICDIGQKDVALIKYIRKLQYGEILLKVQDGRPVMIEEATKKVKL